LIFPQYSRSSPGQKYPQFLWIKFRLSSQNKFNNKIEYFRTLYEGSPEEFKVEAPHRVYGKLGSSPIINLKLVPDFNPKSNFIE